MSDTGEHYRYEYKGVKLDPYRIAEIYGITEGARHQALKKILCAGERGAKSRIQDVDEAIGALTRWKEMLVEDAGDGFFAEQKTKSEEQYTLNPEKEISRK